jgi:phosphoribosylanthranilate isomerase
MLRIKICGITNLDDAMLAVKLGTDAVGCIFYEKSPRYVAVEAAKHIARQLPTHVARVGVFVNTPPEEILQYLHEIPLTAVQLHGDYPLSALQQFTREQVIAVVRVSEKFHASDLEGFQDHAAAILLDTHKKGLYGGTGETFDWQAAVDAKAYGGRLANRVILAGGLNPDNAQQAVEMVNPYALDVSSGVEASPGKKDHAKLRLLFERLQPYRQDWQPESEVCFPLL